jgi:hypothetical protein
MSLDEGTAGRDAKAELKEDIKEKKARSCFLSSKQTNTSAFCQKGVQYPDSESILNEKKDKSFIVP